MNPNVTRLSLYPSISGHLIRAVLAAPTEGCVLETFGAGNCTHRAEVVDALREASERGVVIVNVTQCAHGRVVDSYAAGSHLKELGVVSGLDMTVEVRASAWQGGGSNARSAP
jgi:lysophospholipase